MIASLTSEETAQVTVRSLTKRFAGRTLYQDFDLDIVKGTITCIFGPNGCGKSTLLNMISGLTSYDEGQILFDGKPLSETKIGYVFQNYRDALFPWLKAIDNIEYPLKVRGIPRSERKQRIAQLVDSFGIKIDLNAYPYQLSGGQQQLVSILRALVTQPEVLFLDEPFSALDYETTLSIRDKLQSIFQTSKLTMVMISHDLEEAVFMADRVVLLTKAPTRVAEVVRFSASRPRTPETLTAFDFVKAKSRCLEVFQREVRR